MFEYVNEEKNEREAYIHVEFKWTRGYILDYERRV